MTKEINLLIKEVSEKKEEEIHKNALSIATD